MYQASRIFKGFEQLSSSIAWRAMTFWTWTNVEIERVKYESKKAYKMREEFCNDHW